MPLVVRPSLLRLLDHTGRMERRVRNNETRRRRNAERISCGYIQSAGEFSGVYRFGVAHLSLLTANVTRDDIVFDLNGVFLKRYAVQFNPRAVAV